MKIIVIGSGIVGASAAYHLAKSGIEVVLIDHQHEGKATAAGAGIVCPWDSDKGDEWYRIANAGAVYYPTLISELQNIGEEDVGYKRVGALYVSKDSFALDKKKQLLEMRRNETPEVGDISKLTNAEARELFPPLHEELEAIYVSGAARVDGRLLQGALERSAEEYGVTKVDGKANLLYENGEIIGADVQGERIYADAIIIAAGAWTSEILRPLGVEINIEPQRGQIVHIKMPHEDTSTWPIVYPETSHYLLAFDDARVVAGATRETGSGFDYRLTAGGIHEVLAEALNVAPGLAKGEIYEVRIGFRPMGPNDLPVFGKVEPFPNVVLATGLGASGLTMGPYVGKLAAMIANNEPIEINIDPYHPSIVMKV